MQAKIFLERIFAPYMDGICSAWGVTPEEALRILIKEEATFDKIAKHNPQALKELLNQTEIKVIVGIASPLGNMSDEWIKKKSDILFEVMMDIRPELARGIADTPGGTEWFYQSLVGLRDILFGKPQLNI
ncbi:MAG: hypothetical protein E3J34_02165 [Dehalococcoidia bacterium]|nr:MAG: hypothetical protein E3J34_02165 [Dehalococcoidia bacterium]